MHAAPGAEQGKDEGYSVRQLQSLFGLPRPVIDALVAAGVVAPGRGPRRALRFGFQDAVLLRTACSLQAAAVPARKIVQALQRLRKGLPTALPLTGLRIGAVGGDVAVWEHSAPRSAASGQWLIDFEVRAEPGGLAQLSRAVEVPAEDADAWFQRGTALEAQSAAEAEAAYRQALLVAPDHADASINLGCLLCEAGRCQDAAAVLHQGLLHHPGEALLHFNLAIALEDLMRSDEALAAYEACLKLAPDLADAHFNAARLYEAAGQRHRALRHYNEYRRLQG